MKREIAISIVAGLASIASPAAADTANPKAGVSLLSDTELDSIVAGETIELAQFLVTSHITGYYMGMPVYQTIDMSGLPDEGAGTMFSGSGPDTSGTNSFVNMPAHPIAPLYLTGTKVGTPSDGYGAAFMTLTLETP